MLNIVSLLGPSRCGKGAIIPIIAAVEQFELPFNTPDLDWYVDAYNAGDISADALCRLSAIYLLCYSWYGHLGRHINLRPDDYYSFQRMMPGLDICEKHARKDKDFEFINFLEGNDEKKFWNIFQWDLAPEIFEVYEEKYPINTNPLYCYRSPYFLFTSWISSNRVQRSKNLSRMLKYESTRALSLGSLKDQFEGAKNDNEVEFVAELGTYKYKPFELSGVTVKHNEESRLLQLLAENKKNADYWAERDMVYRFEHIVSNPDGFVGYLKNRFPITFDEGLLQSGIVLMDQRPLEGIVELDLTKVEQSLLGLGCSRLTIRSILELQEQYISEL